MSIMGRLLWLMEGKYASSGAGFWFLCLSGEHLGTFVFLEGILLR